MGPASRSRSCPEQTPADACSQLDLTDAIVLLEYCSAGLLGGQDQRVRQDLAQVVQTTGLGYFDVKLGRVRVNRDRIHCYTRRSGSCSAGRVAPSEDMDQTAVLREREAAKSNTRSMS